LLGDVSLENAVRFYLSHNSASNGGRSVAELVAHFLAAKKEDGVSEAYYRDLHNRTRTLVEYTEVTAAELTAELMAAYFKHLDFAEVNHNNQLRVMRVLLNFAKAHGYLSDGIDCLKSVSQRRVKKSSYPIYQPEEFTALLEGANTEMLPPLVLLGFCGVRPAEMRRLQWRDVRFNTRTLVLDALKTKTASRRTVPICEAALMWLRPYKGSHGQIWSNTDGRWSKSLRHLHQRVKVKQQPNALRHSYISYRLTLTGDVNRTALEAGNSAAMIHSHYHALVEDPRLASQWFEVGMLCQSNGEAAVA
jgi:integrase